MRRPYDGSEPRGHDPTPSSKEEAVSARLDDSSGVVPSTSASALESRVSVIVCTYATDRAPLFRETMRSLQTQERPPDEIVVVVDHNHDLYRRLCEELRGVIVVESTSTMRGISGARTTGLEQATGSIIAFVDDDATARPDWLKNLLLQFLDPTVIVAGSHVVPSWAGAPPRWFPVEFGWVLGCSYRGQLDSDEAGVVRNVYANGMAARRDALQVGPFRGQLGRVGSLPMGCEETEWCIRVGRHFPTSRIVQVPTAVLDHYVSVERTTFRRFVKHCFAEGLSKAAVASLVGKQSALSSERRFVRTTLRSGVVTRIAQSPDSASLLQIGAIFAGLMGAMIGYVAARWRPPAIP